MNLYFAPMEGITTYTYRETHAKMFGNHATYFAPFISPSEHERISKKAMRDILPENNIAQKPYVQVLTNNSDLFLRFVSQIKELGFDKVNINLGCPAGTVVKKGRGAGFLRDTYALDKFLDEIFSKSDAEISLKTRIGYFDGKEMDELLEIYNKYPASFLIIHPRVREQLYSGKPDMNVFDKSYNLSKNKVSYNGDISSVDDFKNITLAYPHLHSVMIGRGAIKNPAIFREIRGGSKLSKEEIVEFTERLCENYNKILTSDVFTLHKLKEVWRYMIENFPDEPKIAKEIKKSSKLSEFMSAIYTLAERN